MRTVNEIRILLDELEGQCADDLETQDLDFKEWSARSEAEALKILVEITVCMANGGGGTVVFGVNDKARSRSSAISGVPRELDTNRLKRAVYDRTDPKITPAFEDLIVPEGTGRLLVMQVQSGLPPYTDTSGQGKVRIGKDCQPLTGTMRRRIMVETGETDFTATEIPGHISAHISAATMERLREITAQEQAPRELLDRSDADLLNAIGVIRNGRLTRAGLLLAGNEPAIREHVPGYVWTYLRMQSDTAYQDRLDGRDALPTALARLTERVMADNPITTVQQGLYHFEYRTYPEIALREALANAFSHADYRLAGPIIVKQFSGKLEISNPGGFIGGISPDNILHHPPVARNPLLVEALTRLRLVNRSNLGVARMFSALLEEGREPPLISEQGDSVRVTFLASAMSPAFREFVTEEARNGHILSVDHLLIFQYLLRHPEMDTPTAARVTQREESEARETLSEMEVGRDYLERGGTGRGTYWMLSPHLHDRLAGPGVLERSRRLDMEAAKARVLSVLMRRGPLSNTEIRQITHLDRDQVKRLMSGLRAEGQVNVQGQGRYARWAFIGRNDH
jgi:ATP-dependent DNA helicase RecG